LPSAQAPPRHRRALITGATRGIGAATAEAFARSGWDLQLLARDSEALAAIAGRCRQSGVSVHTTIVDLADAAAVAPAIAATLDQGGTPGVIINNAGAGLTAPLVGTDADRWQWLLQLNLTSVFQICQALVPALRAAGGGLILNISSHAARHAFPDWGAYGVGKAGLQALSRAFSVEERDRGIRVSTLTLGAVDTSLWDSPTVQATFRRDGMLRPEDVARTLLFMAEQPDHLLIEDLTLLPAAGAL
jgi:NADP-dependent 3-hydroxy acid dehydrogenase YdfG